MTHINSHTIYKLFGSILGRSILQLAMKQSTTVIRKKRVGSSSINPVAHYDIAELIEIMDTRYLLPDRKNIPIWKDTYSTTRLQLLKELENESSDS